MNLAVTVTLADGEAHDYPARDLSGYHRPLNGEAANLTITLDRSPALDLDFTVPPLAARARIGLDGDELLDGVLTRVHMDRTTITLGVEG